MIEKPKPDFELRDVKAFDYWFANGSHWGVVLDEQAGDYAKEIPGGIHFRMGNGQVHQVNGAHVARATITGRQIRVKTRIPEPPPEPIPFPGGDQSS